MMSVAAASFLQSLSVEQRLASLEAQAVVRAVLGRYMTICDTLSRDTNLSELGELFTTNARWEGAGARYAADFGGHVGRSAIVAFLGSYCDPPHFTSNAHFLTSESISVDGDTARGQWTMLQLPEFARGEAFVLAARLLVDFNIEDDCWRIAHFRTTNLVNRPITGSWQSGAPIPSPPERQMS